jgi:iron complex transport system ATP-binding protein
MTALPLYVAEKMSVGYGRSAVVHDVSLTIPTGSHVALIGPNGAGKTTLLRTLAGDLEPQTGRVTLQGQPVHRIPPRQRARRIAYIPPALELATVLTVAEFVGLGRTPYLRGWNRPTARDRNAVDHALTCMELSGHRARDVQTLSEGEKHRAMIALGLAQEPEILLLDEPTAHLDIKHAWQSMELIHALHRDRGVTVIMTSHDLQISASFCSCLMLLTAGRIIRSGLPGHVLQADALSQAYDYPIQVIRDNEHPVGIFPVRKLQ